jgi:DNA-directed RNA polymerase specialized sigma24 family protein
LIAPLTRKRGDGSCYARPKDIEDALTALVELPREEFLERCQIRSRSDPGYVQSECLLHVVRASRHDNNDRWFEQLYKLLLERLIYALPRAENSDGTTASLTNEAIRDAVIDRFVVTLSADRQEQGDKLDFFECRFNLGVKRLRVDAQEMVWNKENCTTALDDELTGEVSAEVEAAVGVFDPLEFDTIDDPILRRRLDEAIDELPPEQRRTFVMLRKGFQIDSDDPSEMTISKALGKTGRTIQSYRDRALASLRTRFTDGEVK